LPGYYKPINRWNRPQSPHVNRVRELALVPVGFGLGQTFIEDLPLYKEAREK